MTGAGRFSIARGMTGVAIVGGMLAVLRHAEPFVLAAYAGILVVSAWLIHRKVILARTQRGFDYALLLVVVFSAIYLAHEIARERLRLLGPAVRWWQGTMGNLGQAPGSPALPEVAEFWAGGVLSLALGVAAGTLAWAIERRAGWDVAAFFRGAMVGLLIAALLLTLLDTATPSTGRAASLTVLMVCFVGGGCAGGATLRRRAAGGRVGGSRT